MACIMKMTCKCHLVRPQKVLWMRYATEPCSTWWQRQGGICPRLRLGEAGDPREIPWRNQLLGTSISVCVTPLFVLRDRVPIKCSFPYVTPCLDFKVTGNRKFSVCPLLLQAVSLRLWNFFLCPGASSAQPWFNPFARSLWSTLLWARMSHILAGGQHPGSNCEASVRTDSNLSQRFSLSQSHHSSDGCAPPYVRLTCSEDSRLQSTVLTDSSLALLASVAAGDRVVVLCELSCWECQDQNNLALTLQEHMLQWQRLTNSKWLHTVNAVRVDLGVTETHGCSSGRWAFGSVLGDGLERRLVWGDGWDGLYTDEQKLDAEEPEECSVHELMELPLL